MPLGPLHISTSGQYIRKNDGPSWPAWNVAEMNMQNERHAVYARLFAYAPELLDMVVMLADGLEWNIENHPEAMGQSDDEALAAARELIAKIEAEPIDPTDYISPAACRANNI